jgi:hypothetical protein
MAWDAGTSAPRFGPDGRAPVGILKGWIAESYGAVAPKRLLSRGD